MNVSSKFKNSSPLYVALSLDPELMRNPSEGILSGDIISNDCDDGPAMLLKSMLV